MATASSAQGPHLAPGKLRIESAAKGKDGEPKSWTWKGVTGVTGVAGVDDYDIAVTTWQLQKSLCDCLLQLIWTWPRDLHLAELW